MIWGLATAQQQRDRCEGPERYLPIGWGRCDVCRRVVPEDSLRETGGQEICGDCLARWETAYACSGSHAEDFARFFWQQLSGRDRAALIRSMLTDQGGLEERLCGEIRHAYCAKHMADFLAGTSADTCE